MKTACSPKRLLSKPLLLALAASSLLILAARPSHAADLAAAGTDYSPKWQARLELGGPDNYGDAAVNNNPSSSRLLSAQLMGDYFLTGSGLGGVQGGLRATGGMLLGPMSMTQRGASFALGQSAVRLGQNFSMSQRNRVGSGLDANDPSTAASYLGLGYTGQSARNGWGFSADLGLLGLPSNSPALRLGNSRATGMEDLLRDLRFQPVLQLGLSYSY